MIAATYIGDATSCLDIAGGPGQLEKFLQSNCQYNCIDGSYSFLKSKVSSKGGQFTRVDLHQGLGDCPADYDVVTMIISLYQFRYTSAADLLESFKHFGKRVLLIEEITESQSQKRKLKDQLMNYLCGTNYYHPTSLFTEDEFKTLASEHGYQVIKYNKRLMIGLYGFPGLS